MATKIKTESEIVLFVDFETRSKIDLKEVGSRNYFLDPSTEIIFTGFKKSNVDKVTIEENVDVLDFLLSFSVGSPIVAHNYKFEFYAFQKLIRDGKLTGKTAAWFGDIKNYRCTKATAQRYGFSKSSLHDLSIQLNLKNKKLGTGKELITRYSKPNRKGEFNIITEEDRKKFLAYLESDILATEEIYNFLPKLYLDEKENKIFELDKIINERGILTDQKNVKILLTAYNGLIEKTKKDAEKFGLEESGTLSVSSNVGLKRILQKNKCTVNDVQEKTLNAVYSKSNKTVQKIIECRRILQAKAPKKLGSFISLVDGGRYYDALNYFGTQPTGRWAGYGIQVHNFPRVVTKDFNGDIEKLKTGENIDIGKMLRGLLIPAKGKEFLVGDFSSIELILTAWVTGCEKILELKRVGANVYSEFAKEIYGRKIVKEKDKTEYQTGKTAVLGLGYGMGAERFQGTCEKSDIIIDALESDRIVKIYRNSFPEIPRFWRDIENAFRVALASKKEVVHRGIKIIFTGRALRVVIPSGRTLYYFNPRLVDGKINFNGEEVWGGVLTAHIVSSLARDILCNALLECELHGLNPVLTVHDEIVNEINKKESKQKIKIFEKIMNTPPTWAKDLPLSAEIGIMSRYGKL